MSGIVKITCDKINMVLAGDQCWTGFTKDSREPIKISLNDNPAEIVNYNTVGVGGNLEYNVVDVNEINRVQYLGIPRDLDVFCTIESTKSELNLSNVDVYFGNYTNVWNLSIVSDLDIGSDIRIENNLKNVVNFSYVLSNSSRIQQYLVYNLEVQYKNYF